MQGALGQPLRWPCLTGAGITPVFLEQMVWASPQGLVPVGVSLGGSSEAQAGFLFMGAW